MLELGYLLTSHVPLPHGFVRGPGEEGLLAARSEARDIIRMLELGYLLTGHVPLPHGFVPRTGDEVRRGQEGRAGAGARCASSSRRRRGCRPPCRRRRASRPGGRR